MNHLTRDQHLFTPGPKRILSLDGGGIRGTLTLEFLKRIEDLLRARYGGDPNFRLSDYFDLIGGDSTGAIIAGALALGVSVDRLQALYRDLGVKIFRRHRLRLGLIAPKFPRKPLVASLDEVFGDTRLGDEAVRTGLMIALKRVDTGRPWMVNNNPRARFFDGDGAATPNREYLLRNVIYASAAAPHYFEPERLEVAPGVEGVFIDGGAAAALNPALHTLMLATLGGYGLRWPLGEDRLLLVSIGSGVAVTEMSADRAMHMPAVESAVHALYSALKDVDWLVQTLMQWMSDSPTRWTINNEIGDLSGDDLAGRPLLRYLRYNAILEPDWLRDQLGLHLDQKEADALAPMDNARSIDLLSEIGTLAAQKQIHEAHFPPAFDISQL